MNELAFKMMTYIDTELGKLANLDVTAGKKGFEKQVSKSHKDGYVEGLTNIRKILVEFIKERKSE